MRFVMADSSSVRAIRKGALRMAELLKKFYLMLSTLSCMIVLVFFYIETEVRRFSI